MNLNPYYEKFSSNRCNECGDPAEGILCEDCKRDSQQPEDVDLFDDRGLDEY
ncbi:hypothetical protein SAMN05443094_11110 [Domibacillus enclensis]|uniref:Uncharacterized protein n=1 Tax=Domibacillus enclensis TaxID=1017273 RepID=A0A1N7C0V8_9BACI|nr:hypothetical protein SAMN05443094_11110 [Domibacillus enclensis]